MVDGDDDDEDDDYDFGDDLSTSLVIYMRTKANETSFKQWIRFIVWLTVMRTDERNTCTRHRSTSRGLVKRSGDTLTSDPNAVTKLHGR